MENADTIKCMTDPIVITKNLISLTELQLEEYRSELEASEHGESPPEWSEWEDLLSEIKAENTGVALINFYRLFVSFIRAQSLMTATNNTVLLNLIDEVSKKCPNAS